MPKRRWANIRRFLAAKPMNSQSLFGYPSSLQEIKEFRPEKGGGAI
jgi:hypothetical protein